MQLSSFLESAGHDLAYAARTFRLNKTFFAIATLSLALGIGANTAIFQLLDAVRLRTLPVNDAENLLGVEIAKNDRCCSGNFSDRHPNFTYAQWEQIQRNQQAFSSIFAWGDTRFNMAASGEPRYAEGLWVSGDFFKTLGVQPLAGRLLSAADDHAGCGVSQAVISYAFWQRSFGGDPGVIGKQIPLDGQKFTIAGITPANFFGIEVGKNFDVAVPMCSEIAVNRENNHTVKRHHWWLAVVGRLNPGWTQARAIANLKAISPAVFETTVPPNYRPDAAKDYTKYKLTANSAGTGVSSLRESYQQPLLLLLSIAGLVLLIACSNLANLMLARASAREREMAVRLAIGANRGRLIRQLLLESLALAVIGAAAGTLLAQFLSQYLVAFLNTGDNPIFVHLGIDWRVLGFTTCLTIVTCLLFGLTPALRATRTDPASAMKASGRGLTADRQRFGVRRMLVVSQVALSLVLLVGALLFVGSLRNLMTIDPGFDRNGLLITGIDTARLPLTATQRSILYRELVDDVARVKGVLHAASTLIVPISGSGWNDKIEILGLNEKKDMIPYFNRISPGYFQTMGTRLLAGRDFNEHDTASSPEVAVVSKTFCDRFLHKQSPIGRQIRMVTGPGEAPHTYEIVGEVADSKYRGLRDDFIPVVFVPQNQDKEVSTGINLMVRSNLPPGSLTPEIKKALLARNAGLSFQFQVFQTQVQDSLLRERLMATLSGFFGFLAAALATVGLYGVISFMVARRRAEIGVRMALGASRPEIVKLVAREAGLLLAIGLVVGSVLAFAAAQAATSFLYGLKATDPVAIGGAIAALALVAVLASILPAARAAQIQPMTALRED
jgi:putative ABC transport system permease protein